jgi:hypothetical protein
MATAGVDNGIGMPVDRDSVPAAALVSEKTDGLWRAPESSSPLVSEKTAGLFRAPESSSPLVSEKTAGLFPPTTQSASAPVVVASDGSGFDWSAAAIGVGGTLAFLLAASTGALAMRRRGMLAH